jgi:hypothetical protein
MIIEINVEKSFGEILVMNLKTQPTGNKRILSLT